MLFDLQQILALPASPPSWLRFALEHNLKQIAAEHKVQRYFLRAVRQILDADTAWYVLLPETGDKPMWDGPDRPCDLRLVREFAQQREPELPTHVLLAPVRVHGRLSAVVVADKAAGTFSLGSGHELNGLCSLLAAELMGREEQRVGEVLLDIKEEILRDLRPQDLVYRILHGLRRLVDYDHSSALLILDAPGRKLRVESEQIAWTRAKSRAIGRELPISAQLADELRQKGERIVARREGKMDTAASIILEPAGELAEVLAYAADGDAPTPTSTLCAPLVQRGRLLGLLRVSALLRSPFNVWDARVVSTFLPAAVSAIQDAHDRQALEHQVASAEQRAYLVNLAKVVAHDINNSLGAALPLAQMVAEELRRGEPLQLDELSLDLETIIAAIEKCSGVFERLLRQEQDPQTGEPSGDLNRAIRNQWTFLEPRFHRRRATCERQLARRLPKVAMFQGDLAHVVLNLMVNALDAMPGEAGAVQVRTFLDDSGEASPVVLRVSDNGVGIPPEQLGRVFDTFFSTKGGTGMGLTLVKRLVTQIGGDIGIESSPGTGTVVEVRLPQVDGRAQDPAPAEVVR